MGCTLVYSDAMADYNLGTSHPLKPERYTLSIELIRAYGLLAGDGGPVEVDGSIEPASDDELALVHDRAYIETVRRASADPERFASRVERGIGPGDTPAAHGMHEAGALIAAGTAVALRLALESAGATRTFAIAGGLHHAHRDRAAGFCVYNDAAVAIALTLREQPELRIAYLDVDAHHGDGVQEAFYEDPRVLTISLHESGRYLFPGTGRPMESGAGEGLGFSVNVPLPPYAEASCYALAFDEAVVPALDAYAPDVIVAACGADHHHADPLAHLGLTLPDMRDLYLRIVSLADEHCGGRLACTGGGGYGTYSVVPRAWTMLAATLADIELPGELPEVWRQRSAALSGTPAPLTLTEETPRSPEYDIEPLLQATQTSVNAARQASPLLFS